MIRRMIAAAVMAAVAGCATSTSQSAPPAIPAPMAETRPLPPVSGEQLLWQPGHWDWNGSGFVWQSGEYVPAEGHGPMFMPGYWAQTPSGWSWQPAHWAS